MRAAVLRNKRLLVDDVPEPRPGPGQVLVETIACGICGSDLHVVGQLEQLLQWSRGSGSSFMFDPERDVVLGHEFSARVVELGPGASGVEAGDEVVALPVMLTGEGVDASSGAHTVGYSNDYPGGYGERMVLMAALCRKIPPGLDPRHAALCEPMSVGVHAVGKAAPTPEEGALVLGCGPIGLAVIGALRVAGIEPIVATDLSPARIALAKRMGAHEAVDPREEPEIEAWRRLGGSKPPVIFEASGVRGMIAQAMWTAPRQARVIVVGVCTEADTIYPMIGVNKELTIQFSLGSTPDEFDHTLALIAGGELDVAPLITGEVGIAGVPEAFETLASPEAHAKILVEPALG